MNYGIKDNKIFDKCTELENKRDPNDKEVIYIEEDLFDVWIGDSYNLDTKVLLKDSPARTEIPQKTKMDLLEERIEELEKQLTKEVL